MIVLHANSVARHYAHEPVFTGLNFQIEAGDRIGLVGPNGAGKTTLMRLLGGKDAPDGGEIARHRDASVAMLEQIPDLHDEQTLVGEVRQAMSHLQDWYDAMVAASGKMASAPDDGQRAKHTEQYDKYQELLRLHGGFDFDHRIEEVLFGLSFEPQDFDRPLRTFSGGQRNRAMLAKLLLTSPDLMLLDEPTNHLDIETTEWLESYLARQSTAMVIVSHDRYFLDKTITKVFELYDGKLTVYPGDYHAYVRQRQERQKVSGRIREKQEEAIAHHQDFIRKNAYGQLAKQAKSREKMVQRLRGELADTVSDIKSPNMHFGAAERCGDVAVSLKNISKAFDFPLFEDVNLEVERGQCVGVIGPNGSGKTTLMRIMLGDQRPDSGLARLGHKVAVGYLEQDLQSLDPEQTALDVVRPAHKAGEKAETFRAILARFGIGADLAEKKIGAMSGGERTRVALARICSHEVNLLALDEPTNHLDLWARESLEKAVKAFEGTVVVISHDRYFLNEVVDRIIDVRDGQVKQIAGNYDRFVEQREAERRPAAASEKKKQVETADQKPSAKRKRKFPFRKTHEIEEDIAEHEVMIEDCETRLASPDVYKDGRKVREVTAELEKLKSELDYLMEHWEEAMELNAS